MKDQLIFDVTEVNDSDNVGAFIRSSDGTLIDHEQINSVNRLSVDSTMKDGAGVALTSSLVGGKQALDVSIVDGVNVEVDLSHLDDSVRLGDGTDFFTSTTVGADIGLDVNIINASIEVTATDLDIRDLTAVSDSVQSHLYDGAGTAITSTLVGADQALDVNVVNEISVNDAALADTAISNEAVTLAVAGTAQDIVTSPLVNRKYLGIYNDSNTKAYIGGTGVSASNGFPVSPGSTLWLRAGASIDIEFIGGASKTPQVRTIQLS